MKVYDEMNIIQHADLYSCITSGFL